ncbi:hypothetical protein [Spirosoma radiotolerans]|nr:hypothetical protein [Spirosoma radiotolerans]
MMDILQKDIVLRTIDAAIGKQQVVQIKLKNTWRTVEPYLVGLHRVTRSPVLYGYCRDVVPDYKTPSRWEIFYLDEVDFAELTSYSFQPHIDYTGRMESIQPVHRRIKPLLDELATGCWPVRTLHSSPRKIRLSR